MPQSAKKINQTNLEEKTIDKYTSVGYYLSYNKTGLLHSGNQILVATKLTITSQKYSCNSAGRV